MNIQGASTQHARVQRFLFHNCGHVTRSRRLKECWHVVTYRGIVHLELFAQDAVEERQFGRDRRGSGAFLLVRCVDMERSIESAMKSTSTAVLSHATSGF